MATATERFAEMAAGRAERRSIPAPPIPPDVPSDDPATMVLAGHDLGFAEGQSFMIEYRDGRGRSSRRRVTVFGLKRGSEGLPLLVARCHERNAQRTFRADRITCCIDYDGEIHDDVAMFLAETFGTHPGWAPVAGDRVGAWNELRTLARHDLVLLSALSHCDGLMCDGEVFVATEHAMKMARRSRLRAGADTEQRFGAYIRRQHPTRTGVYESINHLLDADPDAQRTFLLSAVELIDADGVRHDEEVRLTNEFATDLLGHPLI